MYVLSLSLEICNSIARATAINFGTGTAAGGVASVVSHPLDVIRTRFVGQGEPKVRTISRYSSTILGGICKFGFLYVKISLEEN